MPVDYAQSYTSRFRLSRMDPGAWAPIEEITNVASASIDRDGTDSVPLLETATITVDNAIDKGLGRFEKGWYQFTMIMDQGASGISTEPIATMWVEAVSGTVTLDRDTMRLKGRSVLYPASKGKLDCGTYVPKGVNGAEYCGDLLRKSGPAPVEVIGSFTVDDYFVFQEDTKILEAVWTILDAGNYCVQIAGDGTITIMPKPTEPSIDLGKGYAEALGASYDYQRDDSDIPNVYVAVEGNTRVRSVNDDPDSPTSTVSRGFEVVEVDTSPIRVNGESLQGYADRRLLEERQDVEFVVTYNREYKPGIVPFSMARWHLTGEAPKDLVVKTQTLTIGCGIVVKETAVAYIEG